MQYPSVFGVYISINTKGITKTPIILFQLLNANSGFGVSVAYDITIYVAKFALPVWWYRFYLARKCVL